MTCELAESCLQISELGKSWNPLQQLRSAQSCPRPGTSSSRSLQHSTSRSAKQTQGSEASRIVLNAQQTCGLELQKTQPLRSDQRNQSPAAEAEKSFEPCDWQPKENMSRKRPRSAPATSKASNSATKEERWMKDGCRFLEQCRDRHAERCEFEKAALYQARLVGWRGEINDRKRQDAGTKQLEKQQQLMRAHSKEMKSHKDKWEHLFAKQAETESAALEELRNHQRHELWRHLKQSQDEVDNLRMSKAALDLQFQARTLAEFQRYSEAADAQASMNNVHETERSILAAKTAENAVAGGKLSFAYSQHCEKLRLDVALQSKRSTLKQNWRQETRHLLQRQKANLAKLARTRAQETSGSRGRPSSAPSRKLPAAK